MTTLDGNLEGDKRRGNLRLFSLTWPIFLELFLFMMMGIADTFMLSAVSDNAVAGVGAANQFLQIAILVLSVIGNGASIVAAQYIGSRRFHDVSKISALSVTLNVVIGLVISIAFFLFGGLMLFALNLHGEVLEHADSYLKIVGGAIFLQAVINALSSIVRVHGFTKETMYVSLGMNIIHVIGNYALIFGHFGFPAFGVEGAAISSVVSRLLAAVVFFWLFYKILEVRVKLSYYVSMSKTYIRQILQIGLPSAFEQVMYQGCQITFLFYATFLGEAALAARQYASNISMFIYLFAMAIGLGTSIMVGRLVGGNQNDNAYKQVWKSAAWASVFTLFMVALITCFRYPLMSMFTDDPDIIRLGAEVLLLSFVLETGRTLNIVIINSMRASGDAKFPVLIGLFSMVGMSLPLGYFLVFKLDLGLAGIWLAIAADEWLRAVIVYFRWKSRKWSKYALVQLDGVQEAGV